MFPSRTVILILCALAFAVACDSKSAPGKPKSSGDEPKASTALERPGELARSPRKGLPPELRPPR